MVTPAAIPANSGQEGTASANPLLAAGGSGKKHTNPSYNDHPTIAPNVVPRSGSRGNNAPAFNNSNNKVAAARGQPVSAISIKTFTLDL